MKIKESYLLKEAGDIYVLFPVGQNVVDYKHILTLNATGYFIVKKLLQETGYEELLTVMIQEYEPSEDEMPILKKDLDDFLQQLRDKDILE